MKFLPILIRIVCMTPILFISCEMGMNHSQHKSLNINYPAAFVVNGGAGTISVINLAEEKVKEQISLNGATYPHHIYLHPNYSIAAIAITGTDLSAGHAGHSNVVAGLKIQIIDTRTGQILKEIGLPKLPHNAIFNSNGSELWVGQMDTSQSHILIYETQKFELKKTIAVGRGLSEVTFSNGGDKAFATNTLDHTVSIINPYTYQVEKVIPVGKDPVGAWPGKDGNMYVDNELSKDVHVLSVASGMVVDTIPLGFKPGYVAQQINGEVWVSDASNGRVVIYSQSGAEWLIRFSITTGPDAHAIAFAEDGTKAYVTNQGGATVSVIDVATHTKIQDIPVGYMPNGIQLKP